MGDAKQVVEKKYSCPKCLTTTSFYHTDGCDDIDKKKWAHIFTALQHGDKQLGCTVCLKPRDGEENGTPCSTENCLGYIRKINKNYIGIELLWRGENNQLLGDVPTKWDWRQIRELELAGWFTSFGKISKTWWYSTLKGDMLEAVPRERALGIDKTLCRQTRKNALCFRIKMGGSCPKSAEHQLLACYKCFNVVCENIQKQPALLEKQYTACESGRYISLDYSKTQLCDGEVDFVRKEKIDQVQMVNDNQL